jgi:hypothetical protein
MDRTITLSERVKKYTMLAGSVLATSLAARAQVVYTDIDPDHVLGGQIPSSYPQISYDTLDLNNDGEFDFKLTLTISGTNPEADGFDFFELIDGNFNPLNNVFTYTLGYAPLAFKMDCNDSVPLNQQFYGLNYAVFSFQFGTNKANNWTDVHDKYVGLSFQINGEEHFGWVRLDVNTTDTIPNMVIKEYAYEATAGKKIAVCDTGTNTGIHELASAQESLQVFPNPSAGKVTLRWKGELKGDWELSVLDVAGRNVQQSNVTTQSRHNELPVDLSRLSPGVYLVQLKSASRILSARWTKF